MTIDSISSCSQAVVLQTASGINSPFIEAGDYDGYLQGLVIDLAQATDDV